MKDFLGYKNVVDAIPVLGKDGITDAFDIEYIDYRNVYSCGKTRPKEIHIKTRVYVREFDPNSVAPDGNIHGFGNPVVYTTRHKGKKTPKKPIKEAPKKKLRVTKIIKKNEVK